MHLIGLHVNGSNNPLGVRSDIDKVPFHSYFSAKDLLGIVALILSLLALCFYLPNLLGDPENFIEANPLVTPAHIQPE